MNMEPKNGVLEDDFPFQTGDFQVPAVNFPGCTRSRSQCFQTTLPSAFLRFGVSVFQHQIFQRWILSGTVVIFFMLNESVLFVFRMMIFLHEFATNAVKQCSIFRGTEAKKNTTRKLSEIPRKWSDFPHGNFFTFFTSEFFFWSLSERHVFLDFPCRQRGDLKDGDFPLVTYQHWNWKEGFAWHFRLGVTSDTSESQRFFLWKMDHLTDVLPISDMVELASQLLCSCLHGISCF